MASIEVLSWPFQQLYDTRFIQSHYVFVQQQRHE